MNKKLLLFAILIALSNLTNAQAFPQGSINVSAGYGFGNFTRSLFKTWSAQDGYKAALLGPLHVKAEYMAGEKFGIGVSLNYISVKGTYNINYYNSSNVLTSGTEGIKFNSLSALVRANYYWVNSDRFGIYSGLGLGYRSGNWSFFTDAPNDPTEILPTTSFPLGLEGILGGKVLFTDNIGAYAEIGVAKSIAQIGVVFSFGGERD